MKKKGLAIEGVIFFSILVINICQSFGQVSVRSSNDLLINGMNSNPYIFSSLLWPSGSNSLLYPFLYTSNPFWIHETNQINAPYYDPYMNYHTIPSSLPGFPNIGGPFLNYAYNQPILKFISPRISINNQKHNDSGSLAEWVSFDDAPSGGSLAMGVPVSTMQDVEVEIQAPGMKVKSIVEEGVSYQ